MKMEDFEQRKGSFGVKIIPVFDNVAKIAKTTTVLRLEWSYFVIGITYLMFGDLSKYNN